jgi:putative thiamine transport system substrate-binding protein
MVLANVLLSPEAQAQMQDPKVWGALTVLAVDRLPAEGKARFDALDLGIATLKPTELGAPIPEPHPSWMERIEKEWVRRYTKG